MGYFLVLIVTRGDLLIKVGPVVPALGVRVVSIKNPQEVPIAMLASQENFRGAWVSFLANLVPMDSTFENQRQYSVCNALKGNLRLPESVPLHAKPAWQVGLLVRMHRACYVCQVAFVQC